MNREILRQFADASAFDLPRRAFLNSLAAMPLLPLLPLCLSAAAAAPAERRRSLILLWLDGGMSHLDTFDGKPDAPPDIRGDLGIARAPIDGVFLSEHLPDLSRRLTKCALIRTVTSGEGNHDRGSHYHLTGHRPSPVLTHPALGAIAGGAGDPGALAGGALPQYVAIPDAPEYGGAGFLPAVRGPFEVGGDPARRDFSVKNLRPQPALRRVVDLVDKLDRLGGAPRSEAERTRDQLLAKARTLSLNPEARAVFDLGRESAELRGRYGRDRFGQSCLLARRLVEGGVRTVLVRDRGWDHHVGIKRALTYGFPPKLVAVNRAVAALIDDLERRALMDRVVVLLASEFGRTPRLNPAGGRDHWPRAQSVLLFGAGIRRGVVVGTTDARGEEPRERPVSPGDLFATVITALGGDPKETLQTPTGRPVRVVEEGAAPIREVLAS